MKRTLLFTASSAFIFLALTSSSFGPGNQSLNGTGSPGSNTTCGTCHSGGAGTTTNTVEVRKLSTGIAGPIVTQYLPDTMYIVKLVGNNASLNNFGFQLTALKSTNTNAGKFSNLPANVDSSSVGSKTIIGHEAVLAKTNNQFEVTMNWKAPASGTGNVNFYGVINAVNTNSAQSGDKPGTPFTISLTEGNPASVNSLSDHISISTYPNPVSTELHISLDNVTNGTYGITVFDMNGRKVYNRNIPVQGTSQRTSIPTANWASGIYHVQVSKDGQKGTTMVVKD